MEPEHFESIPEGDIEKYSGAIGNWYRYLDEVVSDLLEEVGESATVVIVSRGQAHMTMLLTGSSSCRAGE